MDMSKAASRRWRHGCAPFLAVAMPLAVMGTVAVGTAAPALADEPGAGATLGWSPSNGDFGTVDTGTTSSQTFTLSKTKGKLGGIRISLAGSPTFSITQNGCTTPPNGNSCEVTVRYAPTADGDDNATLSAATEDGDNSADLNLTGASATPASCTLTARISPSGGDKFVGTLTIDGLKSTESAGCNDAPMKYYWQCHGDHELHQCSDIQLSDQDGGMSSIQYNLVEREYLQVGLTVAVTIGDTIFLSRATTVGYYGVVPYN